MGYKSLFLDENYNYKKMLALKTFIIYIYLIDIKNIIKTSITNRFCKMYGFKEENYLNKNNYNTNHKYLEKTFKIFKSLIEEKKDGNLAVCYYKDNYNVKFFRFKMVIFHKNICLFDII